MRDDERKLGEECWNPSRTYLQRWTRLGESSNEVGLLVAFRRAEIWSNWARAQLD